ncbi:putative aminotransferase [Alternaria tenuissima]|uniref:Putative aminotransferase n=1 Tax=Alternaria tenuissima TaxID=119927 RepID=A0A4Q4M7T7_9PLEO|nr:putative aminotransferase [Alternaria tenuissima]
MSGSSPEPSLLHRSLAYQPHRVVSASGHYLFLEDGRSILDACGGAAVAIIGHGNKEVIAATVRQMSLVSYVHTGAYTTDSAEDLAKCILEHQGAAERSPYRHDLTKAFFVGSGSEANDAAMKCARQYWFEKNETQRRIFVARKQGYHGNTFGAMSVSSVIGRKVPYEQILLLNVSFVGPADHYHGARDAETEEEYVTRLVEEIEQEFLRLGPENIISFIGETVSGATLGAMASPKGYWPSVRTLCDKYGILLHLDEVMCGTGRTGTYFAFEQEDIQPDIVTIGKGLGGGYAPIAGMLINRKIVDALKEGSSAFNHGQTYQAHPTSCATALAVQQIIKRDHLVNRCAVQGQKLGRRLQDTFKECKHIGDIRGRGLFWCLEFMENATTKRPFPPQMAFGSTLQLAAFDLGVALYPGAGTVDGFEGDHILIAPPYTVTDAELDIIVSTLKKAYDDTVKQLVGC